MVSADWSTVWGKEMLPNQAALNAAAKVLSLALPLPGQPQSAAQQGPQGWLVSRSMTVSTRVSWGQAAKTPCRQWRQTNGPCREEAVHLWMLSFKAAIAA